MSNWIKGAIKHPGALTAKAKAEGMSPMQFAAQNQHTPGQTGKQSRFAMILQMLRRKKKNKNA